jgi:sugar lactone lactonase YvrE
MPRGATMKPGPTDPGLRVAVAQRSELGESPMWHPKEQRLYYCDIPGRKLHRFDPRSGLLEHWDFEVEPSAVAPLPDGRLLLALRSGIVAFDPATGARELLAKAPYDTATQRFNDGKCDVKGRFWVSTIVEPREPALGTMSCLSGGKLEQRFDGVSVGNGLAWSPDACTMLWADTHINLMQAFDFEPDSGALSRRRDFARFPDEAHADYMGRPDGAAMDSQGCCWVAMYDGQRVLRLSPQGQILRQVFLPVRCPTMPAFGGHDLKTLYITTAREHRPADELAAQPLAGCVLALDVDVSGLPANFARP